MFIEGEKFGKVIRMKRKLANDEPTSNGRQRSNKRARSESSDELNSLPDDGQDETPTKQRLAIKYKYGKTPESNGESRQDETMQDSLREGGNGSASEVVTTPSKRSRGRPKGSKNTPKTNGNTPSSRKSSHGKLLFATPVKYGENRNGSISKLQNAADRSARRKSARTLIERTIGDNSSDDEEDTEIARHIYDDEGVEGEDENAQELHDEDGVDELQQTPSAAETPTKRGRGRPKGSKTRKRSPTPPQDLPSHELYFAQNRGAAMKTSNNNLSSLVLLDHEEYFNLIRNHRDPHADDIEFLQDLHARSFNQWQFELSQDFNICIYGWGSKRSLLTKFAEHTYKSENDHEKRKIVVVNGYVANTTIRDILITLTKAITDQPQRLGSQPAEMLESFSTLLEGDESRHITLIIHSIDAPPLRRAATQTLLSRIASHPQISLVASADHPSFPLLWDSSLRSTYKFIFHDCTTFQPYVTEIDVVDQVHELLGRSGRRVGGKEGVSFVLKSLPQNAKNLFRVLVAEQLATMDDHAGYEAEEDEYDNEVDESNEKRVNGNRHTEHGVEYRALYQKAVEDFICGDEVSFRTLLKEFHDHQMIHSRKDAMGTELLSVPFRREELETILEDLMA